MYFDTLHTSREIAAKYRELIEMYHPGCAGDDTCIEAIKAEYKVALATAKAREAKVIKIAGVKVAEQIGFDDAAEAEVEPETEAKAKADVVEAELAGAGLKIELIGTWVWVTGDTYKIREKLKALGMRWASSKKAWYWHDPKDGWKGHKGSKSSLEELRCKYGSEDINPDTLTA